MAVRASFNGAHFISVNEPLITQYLSSRAHKTLEKDLNARIKLVNKHNKYLRKNSIYLASIFNFYAWYWHQKRVRLFGWIFRALSHLFKLKFL